MAEGTETNLDVNSTYAVATGVGVGDYAPGKTIVSGGVSAPNGIAYCYVLRQGIIVALIQPSIIGIQNNGNSQLPVALSLQAGDLVRCMTNTATDRECAVYAVTSSGTQRIFVVTPSGAATNNPVDLQTGLSLGSTLQGQTIVQTLATSVDGSLIDGGGVVAVNEVGQAIGVATVTDPGEAQPGYSSQKISIALNYAWQAVTTG
jgi:hypothetical protein